MSISDQRVDPVEILAKVGGTLPVEGTSRRAFEVWLHKVQKAGWEISGEEFRASKSNDLLCGIVMIEGLRYNVYYGPRIRRSLADDSTGELSYKVILGYAAWGEPDLSQVDQGWRHS